MKVAGRAIVAAFFALMAVQAAANEFQAPLEELAHGKISTIVGNPAVIAAVKAMNEKTAGLDQADIDALDKQWRAEVDAGGGALIEKTLGNDLSGYLGGEKEAAGGQFTEIFVMDARGLNVGQSDVTSDYWQGDEAKWSETYKVGPDALHISEIELDESTQTYQSQVSVPVVDPETGAVIGAATFGVDVSTL